jgi:glutathione S-transferase
MLKLWGRPTSTNTQRVLWTLAEAGLSYELVLASGTTGVSGYVWQGHAPYGLVDTDAYRAMNPNGTIPTMDDDGFVLWESNAIVTYIARKYAPHLCGAGEEGFARALRWMIWVNHAIDPATHTLILHLERYPVEKRSPAAVETAREEWVRKLALLEAELAKSRWFAGDAFSIGDIPLGISVQRFLHFGLEHPPMPRVSDWMARLGEREGFRKHVAPREHHLR